MRPPKVSTIPERTGTSYKKNQFFQNLNDVFGQQTQHDPGKTVRQFQLRHNIFSDIVFPLCRLIDTSSQFCWLYARKQATELA